MKVLIVSLYHPELVRGGAQQIAYELFKGLKQVEGVKAVLLASVDQSSPAMFKSGARITGFDGRPNEFLFLSQGYNSVLDKSQIVILAESYKEFLERTGPDVVHFHHFLTFGIDYFTLTRKVLPNAKIIFTAHEFLSICAANGHMRRLIDGSLCDNASARRCHQCLPEHPPEHYFIRELWMKTHLAVVDVFTTPSHFMIAHYTKWGLDKTKFVHVTNGMKMDVMPIPIPPTRRRNRFGFFGQLVDVKGLDILLQATVLLRERGFTDFIVEINGDNLRYATPEHRALINTFFEIESERPQSERNVIFNGSYHHDQLRARMARVDWVVVPSTWWEIFCLVISEAWSFGRPVIASNVGGPAERVTDGKDGLLFKLGDALALAQTMYRACTEDGLWGKLTEGITLPPSREDMVQHFRTIYTEANHAATQ